MSILLDTNILVYAYDPADLDRQQSAIAIMRELQPRAVGVFSVQCLAEFFSVMTRSRGDQAPRLSPSQAYDQVALLSTAFQVLDLTQMIVLEASRAVRDHQLSYFDAQIWASARLNQISMIFSEDFQDGQILEGVTFINPFAPNFDLDLWL